MSYIHPESVLSPKGSIEELKVIYDGGESNYSIASMRWDEEVAVGVRWNGSGTNVLGTPQSRGIPTWFILPKDLKTLIVLGALFVDKAVTSADTYREMMNLLVDSMSVVEDKETMANLQSSLMHTRTNHIVNEISKYGGGRA